jgi:hypothetical protein
VNYANHAMSFIYNNSVAISAAYTKRLRHTKSFVE